MNETELLERLYGLGCQGDKIACNYYNSLTMSNSQFTYEEYKILRKLAERYIYEAQNLCNLGL